MKNANRDASSMSRDGIGGTGLRALRRAAGLGAVQEVRARENREQTLLNAAFESAADGALAIEREQPLDVRLGGRLAERQTREIAENALGARQLLGRALRRADEDLLTARVLSLIPVGSYGPVTSKPSISGTSGVLRPARSPAACSRIRRERAR